MKITLKELSDVFPFLKKIYQYDRQMIRNLYPVPDEFEKANKLIRDLKNDLLIAYLDVEKFINEIDNENKLLIYEFRTNKKSEAPIILNSDYENLNNRKIALEKFLESEITINHNPSVMNVSDYIDLFSVEMIQELGKKFVIT